MPRNVKGITIEDFLKKATTLPLGEKLYKAVTIANKEKGIEKVKTIMAEEGVIASLVTTDEARSIYEVGNKFVKNAKIPDPSAPMY